MYIIYRSKVQLTKDAVFSIPGYPTSVLFYVTPKLIYDQFVYLG